MEIFKLLSLLNLQQYFNGEKNYYSNGWTYYQNQNILKDTLALPIKNEWYAFRFKFKISLLPDNHFE